MNALLVLAILGGTSPTAADGFRANLNSVKVETEFNYKFGVFDWNYPNSYYTGTIKNSDSDPIAKPTFVVDGLWGCDGKTERFFIPDELAAQNKAHKTLPPYDILFDGNTFAFLEGNKKKFFVSISRTNSLPLSVFGPFEWWRCTLAGILDTEFPRISPTTQDKIFNKYSYKYCSYVKVLDKNWERLEIYFDPSWNFVPRFARIMSFNSKTDNLHVKDVLVIDAVQCKAGGFFPTQWYDRSFSVSNLNRKQPGFSETSDTMDLATDGRVVFGHFKVNSYRDTNVPVSLKLGPHVKLIGGLGGTVPIPSSQPTMQDLTRELGPKIDSNPSSPKLNIDKAEINKNEPRERIFPYKSLVASLVSLSCIVLLFRRFRARRLMLLAFLSVASLLGCDVKEPVAPKVSVQFANPLLLCEPGTHSLEDAVIVRNQANSKLRVFGIDGGCSCRSVDKSAFPFDLGPHESRKVPISLTRKNDDQEQTIAFQVSTDAGVLMAMTSLRVVPRLKIIPENLSFVLKESDTNQPQEDNFTVQVRTIHKVGEAPIAYNLSSSPDLAVVQPPKSVARGTTAFAPDLQYHEATYRVAIKDRSLGLKKGQIDAVGQDGRSLSGSSIVWQRRAFLSAAPMQILLAGHQIRVFLHSQDEKTSFTKVKAAPLGVTAVLVSPRELTVARANDHSSKQDGQIQIETDDREHPLLSIDLVHADGS